jgi:hypothetical protein
MKKKRKAIIHQRLSDRLVLKGQEDRAPSELQV